MPAVQALREAFRYHFLKSRKLEFLFVFGVEKHPRGEVAEENHVGYGLHDVPTQVQEGPRHDETELAYNY